MMMGVSTFAALFLVLGYGLAVFGFLFPGPMLSLTDSMGLNRASAMFANRIFARTNSTEDLLTALNRNIDLGHNARIISLTEELIDRKVEEGDPDRINALQLIEEENQLILRSYARALVQRGDVEKAEKLVLDILTIPLNLSRPAIIIMEVNGTPALTDAVKQSFNDYFGRYLYHATHDEISVEEREFALWIIYELREALNWIN